MNNHSASRPIMASGVKWSQRIRKIAAKPTFIKASRKKPGLPPGSLIHIGDQKLEHVTMRLIQYGPDFHTDVCCLDVSALSEAERPGGLRWLDVYGLHEVEVIKNIAEHYGLPNMLLEDIMDTEQSPKVDDSHEGLLFIILKMFSEEADTGKLDYEQVSLVLGPDFVITFQERVGDGFDPLRARIERPTSYFRKHGNEYLFYTILDAILDSYFLTLDIISDSIEALEIELLQQQHKHHLQEIYALKVELVYLRRAVLPLAEILKYLDKSSTYFTTQNERLLQRDLQDSQSQLVDRISTYREILDGLMDLFHSNTNASTNQVLSVLTILSAIFIPLTFITSLYGMNFKFMPELEYEYAYFIVLGVIVTLGLGLFFFFRKKRWL